jgi:hypothetical protein
LLSVEIAFSQEALRMRGEVRDAETGELIPCRMYLQNDRGEWFFPKSESANGKAIEYRKQRFQSVEMHTTLSAHPFVIDLPPGRYTLSVERGKEYLPATQTIVLDNQPVERVIKLTRWINMAGQAWYSGETHVHRALEELPTLSLAEDLNVSFPLSYWVTKGFTPPTSGDKTSPAAVPSGLIEIDRTHVIWPRNTEWEIFTIDGKPHTLGAIFAINHKEPFTLGAPPVKPIAERARAEGALLELDKHNWPWSMMLVPVMNVDLFELSNNHIWRTNFGFTKFAEPPPEYMQIEQNEKGFTERGWIDFGFQNYYALLNCGYRLRPTAGTASGVHPVPHGFGRVYVHLPEGFSYDDWVKGLNAGRSFVTTGPMLFATFNGLGPGETIPQEEVGATAIRVQIRALSEEPLERIELVAAGEVAKPIKPANHRLRTGGYESVHDLILSSSDSLWLAIRCYEKRQDGRIRFAHTAPVFLDVPGKPLTPRRVEINYLVRRIKEQLERSRDVLPAPALAEYREALKAFEEKLPTAR